MSTTEQGQRVTGLDGLRGFAVLAVVLHHYCMQTFLWVGVDVFFVLSGFLITGILLKKKTLPFGRYIGDFYLRRVHRIIPPYVIFLIVMVVLNGSWWLRHWPYLLGAMNFVRPTSTLFPHDMSILWSLAVEEQFYLLWPIAVFFLSRKAVKRLAWTLVICAPLLRYFCTPLFSTYWAIYSLLPFRMDTLAAGALVALYWTDERAEITKARWAAALATAIAIFGFVCGGLLGMTRDTNSPFGNAAIYEASLLLSVALLILALQGAGKSVLQTPALVRLGWISYSLYLIHVVPFHAAPHHKVLAIAAAVVYSTIMWVVIESTKSPVQRMLRSLSSHRALSGPSTRPI